MKLTVNTRTRVSTGPLLKRMAEKHGRSVGDIVEALALVGDELPELVREKLALVVPLPVGQGRRRKQEATVKSPEEQKDVPLVLPGEERLPQ